MLFMSAAEQVRPPTMTRVVQSLEPTELRLLARATVLLERVTRAEPRTP